MSDQPVFPSQSMPSHSLVNADPSFQAYSTVSKHAVSERSTAENTIAQRTPFAQTDASFHIELNALIAEACQYPIGTVQRQRLLTQIISRIQKSGKLWNPGLSNPEQSLDDYHEALQQTWLYLCRNLNAYDPTKASVTTWLNHYLKYRLLDIRRAQQQEQARSISATVYAGNQSDADVIDPIDRIPSPPPPSTLLDDLQQWVHHNAIDLQKKHIQHRSDVNCYILILHRLPPETTWQELSQSFNLSISTLSNFYRRECLPRLRQFVESQS